MHVTKTFISVTPSEAALATAGKLQVEISGQYPEAVPLPLERLHVTVASFGSLKPHRPVLKTWIGREGELPAPPDVSLLEEAELQKHGEKWSWAVRLQDQEAWHFWRGELLAGMGLPLVDEERVFHLSLCNKDGSPFSSVGPAFEGGAGQGLIVSL